VKGLLKELSSARARFMGAIYGYVVFEVGNGFTDARKVIIRVEVAYGSRYMYHARVSIKGLHAKVETI
jgi:hypothetical protein